MNLAVVAEVGYEQAYPLVKNLLLGLSLAAAPRRVRTDQCVSTLIAPNRSLIAGCWQAIGFGRLALREVL